MCINAKGITSRNVVILLMIRAFEIIKLSGILKRFKPGKSLHREGVCEKRQFVTQAIKCLFSIIFFPCKDI